MATELTYTKARKQFVTWLDRVSNDHEVIIIKRRDSEDVAMIPANEVTSLIETIYLLRSPQNAKPIFSALARALENEDQSQSSSQDNCLYLVRHKPRSHGFVGLKPCLSSGKSAKADSFIPVHSSSSILS